MAVQSRSMAGNTPNWYCARCELAYFDPTDTRPCPRCHADDMLEGVALPAPAPATKAAPAKTTARGGLIVWENFPGWLLGTLILLLWWAMGGKYTIEGLPLVANLIFEWFHVPMRLAPITDGRWYLYLCLLPVLISFVEQRYRPWKRHDILSRKRFWLALLWIAVVAIDAGSTYLAIRSPAPNAWTITKQVAALAPLTVTWALLTTFGPESGLSWLWRWLRGA